MNHNSKKQTTLEKPFIGHTKVVVFLMSLDEGLNF